MKTLNTLLNETLENKYKNNSEDNEEFLHLSIREDWDGEDNWKYEIDEDEEEDDEEIDALLEELIGENVFADNWDKNQAEVKYRTKQSKSFDKKKDKDAWNGMINTAGMLGASAAALTSKSKAGKIGWGIAAIGCGIAYAVNVAKVTKTDSQQRKIDNQALVDHVDRNIAMCKKDLASASGEEKTKYQNQLNTFVACRYNEDGKELPMWKSRLKLRKNMGPEKYSQFRKNAMKIYDENHKEIMNANKLSDKISDDDLKRSKAEDSKNSVKIQKKMAQNKVVKDANGNIVRQEEITTPDGKKKKVTTYTGPRGGKFYWPSGSPKDDDHKVYVNKRGMAKM